MDNPFTIVLGGWAIDCTPLKPLFGPDAVYIDINPIMDLLVQSGTLDPMWPEKLADLILPHVKQKPFVLAGWSTGAIMACALAPLIKPAALVAISSTRSFCRKSGFPYGQRSSLLASMRRQLEINKSRVLGEFFANCGFTLEKYPPVDSYSIKTLNNGLCFLEQAVVEPVISGKIQSLFIHGLRDAIIPIAAGKQTCADFEGKFVEVDAPHAFFIKPDMELSNQIKMFYRQIFV